MVPHRMECFRQKEMRRDEVAHPGWRDAADCFHESDMQYGTTELEVTAVGKPQTETTVATPSLTSFAALMHALNIVPRQSQMPQVTSRQGSSEMRLGLEKPQAKTHMVPPMRAVVPDLPQIEFSKPVQSISLDPCILYP
jgi:hypothetical protein